jgi:fatty-acyl-CoA synthase
MLSYAHGADDRPLIGQTIGDFFNALCETHARREASFPATRASAGIPPSCAMERRVGARVIALGIENGHPVGIWSPNYTAWIITQFAAAKTGAILVNVNPAYRVHEPEYALRQSECSMLIAAPPFKHRTTRRSYAKCAGSWSDRVRASSMPRSLRSCGPSSRFRLQEVAGVQHWDDLPRIAPGASADALHARECEQQFDDPIDIQYTSGTRSQPKGTTLSHHMMLSNTWAFGENVRLTDQGPGLSRESDSFWSLSQW